MFFTRRQTELSLQFSGIVSLSLYCLSKLQIFIDWYALLYDDADSYKLFKIENKIEIYWIEPEIRTLFTRRLTWLCPRFSAIVSISLHCLWKLQIFNDWYALLYDDVDSYELFKIENKIEIDRIELEIQMLF